MNESVLYVCSTHLLPDYTVTNPHSKRISTGNVILKQFLITVARWVLSAFFEVHLVCLLSSFSGSGALPTYSGFWCLVAWDSWLFLLSRSNWVLCSFCFYLRACFLGWRWPIILLDFFQLFIATVSFTTCNKIECLKI